MTDNHFKMLNYSRYISTCFSLPPCSYMPQPYNICACAWSCHGVVVHVQVRVTCNITVEPMKATILGQNCTKYRKEALA